MTYKKEQVNKFSITSFNLDHSILFYITKSKQTEQLSIVVPHVSKFLSNHFEQE